MITVNRKVQPHAPRPSAEDETALYEMMQTLRVTGLHPDLCALAFSDGGPARFWEAVRANVETRAFEEGADRLRDQAVQAASTFDRLSALGLAQLGESQAYQAEAAVMLYHYLDPKLLLLSAAAAHALSSGPASQLPGRERRSSELLERGAPARMAPLELAAEHDADLAARKVLRQSRKAFGAPAAPAELLTLALWPRYAVAAWTRLKPLVRGPEFAAAAGRLLEQAQSLARSLPHRVPLAGDEARLLQARELERRLSSQVLLVSLLALDWEAPSHARRSPFPAGPRAGQGVL